MSHPFHAHASLLLSNSGVTRFSALCMAALLLSWPTQWLQAEAPAGLEKSEQLERPDQSDQPERPQKDDPAARLAELQAELADLHSHLPENFRIAHWWGDDPEIRRVTAARARQLSRDVVKLAFEEPDWIFGSTTGWHKLYRDAGRLDMALNVTGDPLDAVAHAKDQLTKLAEVRSHLQPQMQEQVLIRPLRTLMTSIGEQAPLAVIDLVESTEEVLEPHLMQVAHLRRAWLRLKAVRGSVVIRRHPEGDFEPWMRTMLGWWREFLEDDVVLMRDKEQEIVSLSIALHTVGRSNEGLHWLRWLEEQPGFEAQDSMAWLSHAFFASWIGMGDRESGQRYFDSIQRLVDQGEVPLGNDLFRGVTSSYYSQLHKSDVQHRADAQREADARFERSFPDAVRRPIPNAR